MAKAKAKGKAAPKAASAAPEMLLVASKVRAAVKAAGCNFGGDALEALNGYVAWLVDQATKRAGANGRKTVRGADIMIM
jgi:histone H3/H4